ncbi:hypothetical protein [Catellatospora sp. NPDC049609]|uniref:hypothetical protein n=1 Tax=Catellatospora sp. NPDC049609 TaxID=3155505 RepID=UPI00342AC37B
METPNQTTGGVAPTRPTTPSARKRKPAQRPRRGGWTSGQVIVAVEVATGCCVTTWLATESTPVTLSVGAGVTALLGLAFYLHR